MISYCDNKEEIISLWSSVFGDSKEDVQYFIDNLQHGKCLTYSVNDRAVSMLYLVDCSIKNEKAKYIYAACTYKEFEGRGYMTKLIDYAYDNNCEKLCLIPANNSLIDFYKNRGFNSSTDIKDLIFDESDEINEYLFEGFELDKPIVMIKE